MCPSCGLARCDALSARAFRNSKWETSCFPAWVNIGLTTPITLQQTTFEKDACMTAQLALSSPCLIHHVFDTLLLSITGRAEIPSSTTKVFEFLLLRQQLSHDL